jgi:hypothetical protein
MTTAIIGNGGIGSVIARQLASGTTRMPSLKGSGAVPAKADLARGQATGDY